MIFHENFDAMLEKIDDAISSHHESMKWLVKDEKIEKNTFHPR